MPRHASLWGDELNRKNAIFSFLFHNYNQYRGWWGRNCVLEWASSDCTRLAQRLCERPAEHCCLNHSNTITCVSFQITNLIVYWKKPKSQINCKFRCLVINRFEGFLKFETYFGIQAGKLALDLGKLKLIQKVVGACNVFFKVTVRILLFQSC